MGCDRRALELALLCRHAQWAADVQPNHSKPAPEVAAAVRLAAHGVDLILHHTLAIDARLLLDSPSAPPSDAP